MQRILAIGSPGEWIRETLDSDWVGVQHANLFSQFFGGFLPDGTLLGYSSSAAGTDFYTRATFHDDWILAHSDRDPHSVRGGILALVVYPDGSLVAVNGLDYQLSTARSFRDKFVLAPTDPPIQMLKIRAFPDGTILGLPAHYINDLIGLTAVPNSSIEKSDEFYTRATLKDKWVPARAGRLPSKSGFMPKIRDFAVFSDGSILCVAYDGQLYTRESLNHADWVPARETPKPSELYRIYIFPPEKPESRLLATVRSTLVELGDGWRQYLMRTQKIDIRASDLAGELSKVRPINREEPGFADFDPSGNRAIEPGNLARSLLYHALASPDVHPTLDDDSAIADRDYPTWRQLDVIENYIYSLAPFSKNDLKDAVVGVFAYEYRPRAATTHGQHADVNFSRMGIARIGTSEAVYKGAERAYTSITGTTGKIGVLPARYGAFLARKVKGGRDLSLLGEGDGDDGQRTFLLPFRKLFSGKECIPNRDITLSFGEHHRAEKLSRIVHGVQAINGGKGSCVPDGFDVTRPPFIRRSPDPDLVRMTPVGAGVMISAPPHPLVRRAEQNVGGRMLPAMFRVPAESITGEALSEFKPDAGAGNYRHYTALQLPVGDVALSFEGVQVLLGRANSQSRFARNFPFFVYIREEVEYWKGNYNLVDLNKLNDDEFYRYVRNGIYYAAMFEDSTSDGCVVAFVDGLGSNLESCPAFSVVAPLTFFPRSVELDLERWTLQHPDMFHQGDSRPLCEGRFYANPSIVLPTRDGNPSATPAFREQDNTIAAVVGKPPGARNAPSAAPELRKVFRTSFMTDAASNVFFPGWDVTIASRTGDIADKNFFYTTYGMGSPYPEDVKFCAAANGFWPTASPDAGRTFHRSDSPTSIFLVDDELGYHPSHPAAKGDQPGWDGGYGPFFQLDAGTGAPGVNFANLDRVDYVRDALEGKFGRIQFAHLTSDVLIERMSCQRRCVEVLKQTYFPKEPDMGVVSKTRLWLISAQRVEKSPDLDDEPGYLLVYALSSGPKRSLPGADGRYTRRWEPIENSVYVCRVAPSGKNKTWKIDAVDWTKTRWKTFT
jgi:hypothetical protein